MLLINGRLLAAGAVLLASNIALAQGYGGLGYSSAGADVDGVDFDLGVLYGRIGSQVDENISAEFRVGVGTSDDTIRGSGGEATLQLDKFFGAYFRGSLPLNDVVKPYVILGFTNIDVEVSYDTFLGSGSESDSDTDVSYGVGIDFQLDNQLIMNVEYMKIYDDEEWDVSGLALGVAFRF